MTGCLLMSSMPAMMRSLSSCFEVARIATDKIGSHCWKLVVLTSGPPVIYSDALSFDLTGFREPLEEASHVRFVSVWRNARLSPAAKIPFQTRRGRKVRKRRPQATALRI